METPVENTSSFGLFDLTSGAYSSELSSPPPSSDINDGYETVDDTEESSGLDNESNNSPSQRRYYVQKQGPRRNRGTISRLQDFTQFMAERRWGIEGLISAWVSDKYILSASRYATGVKRRNALHRAVLRTNLLQNHEMVQQQLKEELRELIKTPYFGRFSPDLDLNTMDFNSAFKDMQEQAPIWYMLLSKVLVNSRSGRQSYTWNANKLTVNRRIFVILSIICHSHALKTSNFFAALFSAYLHGSGVKRRVKGMTVRFTSGTFTPMPKEVVAIMSRGRSDIDLEE
ncbi:predicted protein [Histoplasma mississippiense (nom. inval.)]|uniref:predicted protein n=1 Tax=Ajellomyces capsulatus (strain NAm1 / WU24) TaxID=2059318 RepID=UPI000157D5B3|nr:predicted protein [Histoplasma mississippiense (nom. inval.)]EDN05147.1 predicted protein [Histoplasma mississippiense (nom. inval.)]